MTDWPTGWREATLRQAKLSASPFALKVLSAWNKSTPVTPQYNNPLGMPHKGHAAAPYLNTPYAAFPTMAAFRQAFALFLASNKGTELRHTLDLGESMPAAWRAIHALPWPAKFTETDWPSALLDILEEDYKKKLGTRAKGRRKTSGVVQARPDIHAAVRQEAIALHVAATSFDDARQAVRFIMRGLN